MKRTRNILHICLFLLGSIYSDVKATGLSGAAITYQLIDANTGRYKISLEYYMICAHSITIGSPKIKIIGSPSASEVTLSFIKKEEISPIALPPDVLIPATTYCNSGNGPYTYGGYYKNTYEGTVTIGKNIGFVIFGWQDCCRDNLITNGGSSGDGVYVQAGVNTNFINSSPIHSKPEMIHLYKNKLNKYNMRATDIHEPKSILVAGRMVVRDSFSYQFMPSFTGMAANSNDVANFQNASTNYNSGLSGSQCFYTSLPMSMNQSLAQVLINPDRDQLGHMAYLVREFRAVPNTSGTGYTRVLVGYTMRDVVLGAYGTADPIFFGGIVKDLSSIDTLYNSYTAGSCKQDNKIVFKAIGAPYRQLRIKDLSVIEPSLIGNYKMSYITTTGNNVDTAYVTISYRRKSETPSLNFLYDAYYVNANGIIVNNMMPITVVPGVGFVQLAEDTVYYCSSGSIKLDASIAAGAKWSPLTSVISISPDSSIIEIAPTAGRWYRASNLTTTVGCKLNDSVYVKVQACDTVYGVICVDKNKNCLCDPWEYKVKNASFDVKGVTNLYTATVTTDSTGAYRFVPPALSSYHIESDGMLFNCGINNKKTRAFSMTLFGNMKVDIPVLDSVVISKFTTAMLDTNFCHGDSVHYHMHFFKNFGLMRAIMYYGNGKVDTVKNYTIESGFISHSFSHKYSNSGQYIAKIVFTDHFYSPKDSVIFKPILISNCIYGKVYIDGNKDCNYFSSDKLLPSYRLELKNNTTSQTEIIYTLSNGSYKMYLKKNQGYTLSNAVTILCNSNSAIKSIPAFANDTTLKMDIPLDPDPVNYILVVQKSGSIANNKKLELNLTYSGYYFSDTAIKKYEVRLPLKTKVDAISSNATYTQTGTVLQIIQNTGTQTLLTLKFDSLTGSDTFCFFARLHKVAPETDTSDNKQYFCLKAGELDLALNQKQVSIASQINHEDFLNKNDELIYQINFINNRTSTANHVLISDIIDSKLDLSSFKLIKQSHDGQVLFRPGNEVVFVYQNINLPDSASNNSGSRGYVVFSLKPLASLSLNDIIQNHAVIVVDFIQNIRTNTTLSRYITKPVISIQDLQTSETIIYPNPTSDYLYVRAGDKTNLNNNNYYLTNLLGQQIPLESFSSSSFNEEIKFNLHSIPNGIYLLQGIDAKGEIKFISKVNVMH